ncbi:N-acetylmuramoyl-L-alanine amidase [Streptomyces sp. NPDC060194]|uniref:N-acetylmuramoyl-L-alanine amidase n=1 Tax=Streptomyces sp. NPDC060194 TaxID=3347069 RepID=UPI00365B12D1
MGDGTGPDRADTDGTGGAGAGGGAGPASGAPGGADRGAPKGPERKIGRRKLLIGGGIALAGGVALTQDAVRRLWWQVPGVDRQRVPGAVDFAGATWAGASEANLRYADRPDDYTIDRIVIHVTQGSYASALRVFRSPLHAAAAHYVVRAKDGRIAQCVQERDVAFHAGNRAYNERSVGIEHEGFVDRPEDFTDVMYESSARLAAAICVRHGFPPDREHIIAHHEVPGADHTDPGPHWDWDRYIRLVRAAEKAARTKQA